MFKKLLRAGEGRTLRTLELVVAEVAALEEGMVALTDDELRAQTVRLREKLSNGATTHQIQAEGFAVAREAARRVLGQRAFDTQVMGAAALARGMVAEMKTGEGKTLVSVMPAYLEALRGEGVHVVTVNEYLAERDAGWMGRVHRFLGLEVGITRADATPSEKRAAYRADITYGTNNEFGFDYLRDNMAASVEELTQRGHPFAIVDEVDSILIDEARTPLIIAGRSGQAVEWFNRFAGVVKKLTPGRDYEVDERRRQVVPTEDGIARVEQLLGISNLYDEVNVALVHHLEVALSAKEIYRRDNEYIVRNREVLIVDEFTGRVMEGRRYSDGIHQAIEAKEKVPVLDENLTMATITLQNYFRMYGKLSGMTGTAVTEAAEFSKIYGLEVVEIPTNRPVARIDGEDLIFASAAEKWAAVVEDVRERNAKGQPVLLGTASIERSEELSRHLKRAGVRHNVLNAKHHAKEAEIIAEAGRVGAVTVATNMAGRGVDVMLGGNPETREAAALAKARISEDDPDRDNRVAAIRAEVAAELAEEAAKVRAAGGLYVLGTERHESRRIDNQLRGRSGRQGDPGESRFFLSAEDELVQRFGGERITNLMARLRLEPGQPITHPMISKAVERAQTQVESQNFEIRKELLKYDDVGNSQREVLYELRQAVLRGESADWVDRWVGEVADYLAGDGWDGPGMATAAEDIEETSLELARFGISAEAIAEILAVRSEKRADLIEDALAEVIEAKAAENGDEWGDVERAVILDVIDRRWVDHLTGLDHLRSSVGLRAVSGSDPIHEYQREAYRLFVDLMEDVAVEVIRFLANLQRVSAGEAGALLRESRRDLIASGPGGVTAPAREPARADQKPGRNEPCHCGSGKKYKRCHGAA